MHQAALLALRTVLRGVARMLLRAGVTSRDAEEVLRECLVEVALGEYGLRGRPTNISRVAMLTGLTRREASRIRDRLQVRGADVGDESHPLGRVLTGWHLDPDFSSEGEPLALAVDDESSGLPALFARYAAGLPPVAVRKELQRVGALELVDGLAVARARYYLSAGLDPRSIHRYGFVVRDLLRTLNHNVLGDLPERPRFEGRAVNLSLTAASAEALRCMLDTEAEGFLERIDVWLDEHADLDGDVRAGVGIYLIHDDQQDGRNDAEVPPAEPDSTHS